MFTRLKIYVDVAESSQKDGRMGMKFDIVVVGGSTAGFYLVKELRAKGYTGTIGLIEKENALPYNRYKLSKTWMQKDDTAAPIFKEASFFAENEITLLLNTEVTSILKDQKKVVTVSGKEIEYGKLVIAIGAASRQLTLEHEDAFGIFYLRSYEDALKIKEWGKKVKNVVLIGAGFIGLELASSFRERGMNVTVVEYSDHPLGRVVGEEVSQYFLKMHQKHGVTFLLGTGVKSVDVNEANEVTGIVTDKGENIPCDMVIIGIGAVPNMSITESPFDFSKNISVNEFSETGEKDIYAVGDCTIWPFNKEMIHVEHWEHAQSHGKNLALNLIKERSTPYNTLPYFWTDHYDETFEYLGHALKWEKILLRGTIAKGKFTVAYVDEQNVPQAILFANGNDERDDVEKLMTSGKKIDPEIFADTTRSLSEM